VIVGSPFAGILEFISDDHSQYVQHHGIRAGGTVANVDNEQDCSGRGGCTGSSNNGVGTLIAVLAVAACMFAAGVVAAAQQLRRRRGRVKPRVRQAAAA
jgi:hypothetical protein